jgi:hypothetical protein
MILTINKLKIHQLEVKIIFSNCDLDKGVYATI